MKEKSYHLLVKFLSIFRLIKLQADFQQTPSGLPVDYYRNSLQTPKRSQFGEHIWRALQEKPFHKLPADSHLLADSQWTPSKTLSKLQKGLNLESTFGEPFKRDHFINSRRTPISQQTPSGLPADSQWTPNKVPKRLQPGLDLDTSFGDLNWIP